MVYRISRASRILVIAILGLLASFLLLQNPLITDTVLDFPFDSINGVIPGTSIAFTSLYVLDTLAGLTFLLCLLLVVNRLRPNEYSYTREVNLSLPAPAPVAHEFRRFASHSYKIHWLLLVRRLIAMPLYILRLVSLFVRYFFVGLRQYYHSTSRLLHRVWLLTVLMSIIGYRLTMIGVTLGWMRGQRLAIVSWRLAEPYLYRADGFIEQQVKRFYKYLKQKALFHPSLMLVLEFVEACYSQLKKIPLGKA